MLHHSLCEHMPCCYTANITQSIAATYIFCALIPAKWKTDNDNTENGRVKEGQWKASYKGYMLLTVWIGVCMGLVILVQEVLGCIMSKTVNKMG